MSSTGYIKLYRQMQEHDLWKETPFTRAQAWIDLLLTVNYETKKILFDGEFITVERGSIVTSIRKLCEKWGWSNKKVTRFLNALELDGMLTKKSTAKATQISVVNYSNYQDVRDAKAPPKHRQSIAEASQRHTNNKEKEVKEGKEKSAALPRQDAEDAPPIGPFVPYQGKRFEDMTQEEKIKFLRE